MIQHDNSNSILFEHGVGEEWYQSVEKLVDMYNSEIEPSDNSPYFTHLQDHDPFIAYVQDENIIGIDENDNVIGLVTYSSGLPDGVSNELNDYTPCVYISQIFIVDEYKNHGLLEKMLDLISDRVSTRYEYFVTRVWSGNRVRLHNLVSIDFSVTLECDERDDEVKAYYYVSHLTNCEE